MPRLLIANTCFEKELETGLPFWELKKTSGIFSRLQFLPLLYADDGDTVLVDDRPPTAYLEALRKKGFANANIITSYKKTAEPLLLDSWGYTPSMVAFSQEHSLLFDYPDCNLVKKINSKVFSFQQGLPLHKSTLIDNEGALEHWIKNIEESFVLKTVFGFSAKGHRILNPLKKKPDLAKLLIFCKAQWEKSYPVLLEPWVDRICDFSTQWVITQKKEILYLGATLCKNDREGHYVGSVVGEEVLLFNDNLSHIQKHKLFAKKLLKGIAHLGYFGNIGLDAFLYREKPNHTVLHPLCEINARKTMGWVALQICKRLSLEPSSLIEIIFRKEIFPPFEMRYL
jgi:hypothetical protein